MSSKNGTVGTSGREPDASAETREKPSEVSFLAAVIQLVWWMSVAVVSVVALREMLAVCLGQMGVSWQLWSPESAQNVGPLAVFGLSLTIWLLNLELWLHGDERCPRTMPWAFPVWFVREYVVGWYEAYCQCRYTKLPIASMDASSLLLGSFFVGHERRQLWDSEIYSCPYCHSRRGLILLGVRGLLSRSWVRVTSAVYLRIYRAKVCYADSRYDGYQQPTEGFEVEDRLGQRIFFPTDTLVALFRSAGPFGSDELVRQFRTAGNGWTGVVGEYQRSREELGRVRQELAEKNLEIIDLESRMARSQKLADHMEEILRKEHRGALDFIWSKFRELRRWPKGAVVRELMLAVLVGLDDIVLNNDPDRSYLDVQLEEFMGRLNQSTRDSLAARAAARRRDKERVDAMIRTAVIIGVPNDRATPKAEVVDEDDGDNEVTPLLEADRGVIEK
ncbi:MAG: hypothetical protein COV10_00970 [Candidatus Vogelbacteria bacterium CG10_big_fil_rev_8_21_14_0_10_51_16]|uniref:Uncharacterized protein n=1 Tax=Candidatus Vogelbacteria bacterium CG10_big_fil_rev_8_21_14_0_10_51_16 TaxID=1975045 RepID=A0A2H0REV4_9BACT|nr:MAG: hypothetical protein COV10_00970 [Candidatus Vogelbacteria bacterium CG10_big_fil_rev_8_21_14_0_10_51_16]